MFLVSGTAHSLVNKRFTSKYIHLYLINNQWSAGFDSLSNFKYMRLVNQLLTEEAFHTFYPAM